MLAVLAETNPVLQRGCQVILPYPEEVREAREEIGFSQLRAAGMVHVSLSAWRKWETGTFSKEYRQIPGSSWELFVRKTDCHRPKDSRYSLRAIR